MAKEQPGWGAPGEIFPTVLVLIVFCVSWGLVQFRDGTQFLGLSLVAPLAAGMLSGASARMVFGRNRGGLPIVGGAGAFIFLMMLLVVAVIAGKMSLEASGNAGTFTPDTTALLVGVGMGVLGAFLGALSLNHYRVTGEVGQDEDTDDLPEEEEADDIDYSTEPEELVCLLTNQVVNRDHDTYVVCHNRMNVTQVCHAVYLKDYVHLLEGRCRRCYQPLRERDLKGMGKG